MKLIVNVLFVPVKDSRPDESGSSHEKVPTKPPMTLGRASGRRTAVVKSLIFMF